MEQQSHSIRTVKLWIKAFIPNTYERAVPLPGADDGRTMVSTMWLVNRWFLTDQRGFSSDIHAEARMHSEIEIDVAKGKETYQFHHCYDTVEVDGTTGEEKCRAQGDSDSMRFHGFHATPDRLCYTFKLKAGSRNPCVKVASVNLAPSIDYLGSITITIDASDPSKAVVAFSGKVEKYPAFEMYASANNGEPQTLFQIDVAPHGGVGDLPGGPERSVYAKAELNG